MKQLSQLTLDAMEAALLGGEVLKLGFGSIHEVTSKGKKHDIVTKFDHEAERAIISHLLDKFPDHSILAEESGHSVGASNGKVTWLIDPLDGTLNFAHHIPAFAVSVAAIVSGELFSAVIFQPMLNELFVAEKGQGAFLNGQRLEVSKTEDLESSLVAASLSFVLHGNPEYSIDVFTRMANVGNPLRASGSSALNLAYVAAGRYDAFWSTGNLYPWDLAAGKLLIEEAGGKVTRCDGSPCDLSSPTDVLATNKKLHKEILAKIN